MCVIIGLEFFDWQFLSFLSFKIRFCMRCTCIQLCVQDESAKMFKHLGIGKSWMMFLLMLYIYSVMFKQEERNHSHFFQNHPRSTHATLVDQIENVEQLRTTIFKSLTFSRLIIHHAHKSSVSFKWLVESFFNPFASILLRLQHSSA